MNKNTPFFAANPAFSIQDQGIGPKETWEEKNEVSMAKIRPLLPLPIQWAWSAVHLPPLCRCPAEAGPLFPPEKHLDSSAGPMVCWHPECCYSTVGARLFSAAPDRLQFII